MMPPPDGYYSSKKTDDISDDYCGQHASRCSILSMATRLRSIQSSIIDIRTLLLLLIILPSTIITLYIHGQKITYFLRPFWQSPPKPFIEIPHYYNSNLTIPTLCSLHGWQTRTYPRRVYDAILFNNELDMLEIRWNELSPYITQFVLLESNSTFTAIHKPLYFKTNLNPRFTSFQSRLTYANLPGRFRVNENPFIEEGYQRLGVDQLLKVAGIEDDDLLIMSDVDEIPSRHTIDLLRWCDDIPDILHLRMRNYLYSYEFHVDDHSWRASVHRYKHGKTKYAHYRQTDLLLADSGWHCSFCFRTIEEFVFKMKAYSHTDRVRFSSYLNWDRIQRVICEGRDLFDMLPEEYSFKEIIGKMGPIPRSFSGVNLPAFLLQNAQRFKYLLPGNCKREGRGGKG